MSDLTHRAPVTVAAERRPGSIAAERRPGSIAAPSFNFSQVLPWLIFASLLTLVALYFVGAEEGAFAVISGSS